MRNTVQGQPETALIVRVGDVAFRVALIVAVFLLYWTTAAIRMKAGIEPDFGADTSLYMTLAHGISVDRIAQFHPVTGWVGLGGMAVMRLLAGAQIDLNPQLYLASIFAAVGAIGVAAAMAAFSRLLEKPLNLLFTVLYAGSFSVWYFASMAESKIVTTSLVALYVIAYLRWREKPTLPNELVLGTVFAMACLNEITAAMLILIPACDMLFRRHEDYSGLPGRISTLSHLMIVPLCWLVLETRLLMPKTDLAASSDASDFWSLFINYFRLNSHDISSLGAFLLNWFPFALAAPADSADAEIALWPNYFGYFPPTLGSYLETPAGIAFLGLAAITLIMAVNGGVRHLAHSPYKGLAIGFLAYSFARAVFFFVFNPSEAMLFAGGAMFANLALLALLLQGGRLYTPAVVAALCTVTILDNAAFMFPVTLPQQ